VSDDIVPDQLLTIPADLLSEKDVNTKQVLARIHPHDYTMLRVMLKKDKMSFQKFALFCVRAYLDGDPFIIKMLKNYRELESVPQDIQDKHVLSHRERQDIYKELETAQRASEK